MNSQIEHHFNKIDEYLEASKMCAVAQRELYVALAIRRYFYVINEMELK